MYMVGHGRAKKKGKQEDRKKTAGWLFPLCSRSEFIYISKYRIIL
jgi:hypothetical protein